jgi:hypothetical protein
MISISERGLFLILMGFFIFMALVIYYVLKTISRPRVKEKLNRIWIIRFRKYGKKLAKKLSEISNKDAISSILAISPMLIYIGLIAATFAKRIKRNYIWLESPKGKFYKFPIWQALRIERKHDWEPAEVEPVLSRWQGLKRFLGMRVR